MKRLLVTLLFLVACGSAAAANPKVEIRTSQGVIVVELFEDKAPESVRNFLDYVNTGFYDDTIFHRVIDGFMIQGGGFDAELRQKPTREPIRNEAKNGLRNEAGTIAMARTRDPHSAASQFFINLVDNRPLDYPSSDGWGYAVFGKVSEGFDVVQKIGRSATGNVGPFQNVPIEPVVVESMRVIDSPAGDGTNR
ncbi:MAG TPA: peptidylprolyl isomerase [Rhodocyclaceae bacterium]|nr:peptidylprolyl isomerase [Rhodocyclaceae bacterium]